MQRPKSFVVRIRATVIRDVVVEGCTEEQARSGELFNYSVDEIDIETTDFEVQSVMPND